MNAITNNPVGRPRSFDEAKVMGEVMDVFWRQGYDGTSMADILNATGLHKGSIYQAFGGKHTLFVKALKTYTSDMGAQMQRLAEQAASGIEALRAATQYHIEHGATEGGYNTGCLALNTLVENAQDDPEVMAVLQSAYAKRTQLMGSSVARAQAEGDIRNDWPPERIVRLIAATEAGILVELKGALDEVGARAIMEDLLASLA